MKICFNVKSTKGGKQKGSVPTTATKGKIISKNVYSVEGYAQDCDVCLMLEVSLLCVGQGTVSYLCLADFIQKIFEFILSLLSTLLLFFVMVYRSLRAFLFALGSPSPCFLTFQLDAETCKHFFPFRLQFRQSHRKEVVSCSNSLWYQDWHL